MEKPIVKSEITNTENPDFGVGTKVYHNRFLNGVVIAESAEKIDIEFEKFGSKLLLKQYAILTKI